jgi:uncharacterized membrane protein (DUF373 family)
MKYVEKVERAVVLSLLVMMLAVLCLATADLVRIVADDIVSPPLLLLEIDELLEIFGMFLLVLVGVELLETVKMYVSQRTVHVEVVFTVALIAIARKVVILDLDHTSSLTLIGIGTIIVALSVGYYLLRQREPADGTRILHRARRDAD